MTGQATNIYRNMVSISARAGACDHRGLIFFSEFLFQVEHECKFQYMKQRNSKVIRTWM
jgi:hypothetical protein